MSWVLPPHSVMETWPSPDYTDPPSHKNLLLGCEIALVSITTVVVLLRIISRACLTVARVELEDWLMLAAWVCSVALVAVNIIAVHYGWGRHIWDTKLEWLAPVQKTVMANEMLFTLTAGLSKMSILVFYWRVFSAYREFRWMVIVGAFFVLGGAISGFVLALLQCLPIRAFWDVNVKEFRCVNMYKTVLALALLNCASDIYLFTMPIRWVWKLRLPTRQRIGLVVAFCLGLIVCVVGIVRLKYMGLSMHNSADPTWYGAIVYILNAFEADLSIICASLPALRPLLVKLFPSGSRQHRGNLEIKPKEKPSKDIKEISRVWRRFNMPVMFDSGAGNVSGVTDIETSRLKDGDAVRRPSELQEMKEAGKCEVGFEMKEVPSSNDNGSFV